MKRAYIVEVREVFVSNRVVYAESPEKAIEAVDDGEDEEEISCEYSHTLDSETWRARLPHDGELE